MGYCSPCFALGSLCHGAALSLTLGCAEEALPGGEGSPVAVDTLRAAAFDYGLPIECTIAVPRPRARELFHWY